jgi:GT2 family glycosyltransferase
MSTACDISLVVATYGRTKELQLFLESIRQQNHPTEKIEIILVDQNAPGFLDPILDAYQDLRLLRLVAEPHAANARSLGQSHAQADLIAFPDDDCTYYPDTIPSVLRIAQNNPNVHIFKGRIWDRQKQKNIIRNWPAAPLKVTIKNFYTYGSAITSFCRRTSVRFDSRLGPGTPFGSNEDTDWFIEVLKAHGPALYTPEIEVWHPEPGAVPATKAFAYGMGFGALARKQHLELLWLQAQVFHLLALVIALCQGRWETAKMRKNAFWGRCIGYLKARSWNTNSN